MLVKPSVFLYLEPHLSRIPLFQNFNCISQLVLVYLFLLVLQLLAGQEPSWLVVVLHKIAATIGGGVSVAKAQRPWMAVVGP